MNLDELLKCDKVRCVKTKVDEDLVEGETYKVEGFNDETIKIVDSNGFSSWHNKNLFEPVLNNDTDLDDSLTHLAVGKKWREIGCNHVVTITEISSEFANSTMVAFESDCCLSSSPLEMFLKDFEPIPNNNMSKSNTEIYTSLNSVDNVNNVIPTFKVGDKVYFPNMAEGKVLTLLDNKACHYPFFVNVTNKVNNNLYELDSNGKTKYGNFTDVIVKATQENYEILCKLYPHIEFEFPPEPLTGNELCYLMLRGGHTNIMCQVGGDKTNIRIITLYAGDYFYDRSGNRYSEVVPIDTKGIPLTEDVLNETINK